jgi:hypothetical protein
MFYTLNGFCGIAGVEFAQLDTVVALRGVRARRVTVGARRACTAPVLMDPGTAR